MYFLPSSQQFSTQLYSKAAFPYRLIAHWWKTNAAFPLDLWQTSERMLVELGSNSQPLDWQPVSLRSKLPRLSVLNWIITLHLRIVSNRHFTNKTRLRSREMKTFFTKYCTSYYHGFARHEWIFLEFHIYSVLVEPDIVLQTRLW